MARFTLAPGKEPVKVDAGAEFVVMGPGDVAEIPVAYAERYVKAGQLISADWPALPNDAVGVYNHHDGQVVEAQDF